MALLNIRPEGFSNVAIRRLADSDVPAVFAVLSESAEAAVWSADSFYQFTTDKSPGWVAEEAAEEAAEGSAKASGHVLGFLIGRIAGDEFEILNLAVARTDRRQGIASKLMEAALGYAHKAGGRRVYLEVRASNRAAIELYKNVGFAERGRRARYYRNPVEDALVLAKEFAQAQEIVTAS